MKEPARNQLVWLAPQAWAEIDNGDWDDQARDILACWRTHQLPLVVARQRGTIAPDQVCLGLPAPAKWSRRRLALTIDQADIGASGHFPALAQVAQAMGWEQAACDWVRCVESTCVSARVYGSLGWQFLTGLSYVHPDSDLDLSLEVDSWAMACALVLQLDAAPLPVRLDGEIVFANGHALAWRELHRLLNGQTTGVMVKDRRHVWLATLAQARALAGDGKRLPRTVAMAPD